MLSTAAARKLFLRTDILVMHVFGGEPQEHQGADREGLREDLERFWRGEADPTVDFQLGEFRCEAEFMLMIVEGC